MQLNLCKKRRQLLAVIVSSLLLFNVANGASKLCRCQPTQACWPKQKAWVLLAHQLTGRLVKPKSPLVACKKDKKSKACLLALKKVHNPFYLQSMPGGSESYGWWKAWTYQNSVYAVEVKNTQDVVAAVNFARQHHLKLVIKGAGHDYLGRSNAPDSLLIWTHHLQTLVYHKAFVPAGAPKKYKPVSALTVGAGVVWLQAYQKAAQYHRLVLGGGCTSVGAAGGFTLGGGFGSWSKKYGTGAGNLLQAKIVLADGRVLTVNAYQHPDLFWALRGAGFGLGVVTQMTYRTYPLPRYFGFVDGGIAAKDDSDYRLLIKHLLVFLRKHIINQHWGEHVDFYANNTIKFSLASQGMDKKAEQAVWAPFVKWVKSQPKRFAIKIHFNQVNPYNEWRYSRHNSSMILNKLPGVAKGEFWWSADAGQTYSYWVSYDSWWLPMRLFSKNNVDRLAVALFHAAKHLPSFTSVQLHLNKGLAGASSTAIEYARQTSMNPNVYHAAGLIIIAVGLPPAIHFDVPQALSKTTAQTIKKLRLNKKDLMPKNIVPATHKAMQVIKQLAPHAGSYVNETSYFEPHWQQAFWGDNYPQLLKIKHKYDPDGLFYCYHCVGSELWKKGGMCRR